MGIILNNSKPSKILYNGNEISLYLNGIKIWPETEPFRWDGYVVTVRYSDGSSSQVSAQGFKMNGNTVASTDVKMGYLYTQDGASQWLEKEEIEGACGEHDQFIMWGKGAEFWFYANDFITSFEWHCFTYFQPEGEWTVNIYPFTGNARSSEPIYTHTFNVAADATLSMTI